MGFGGDALSAQGVDGEGDDLVVEEADFFSESGFARRDGLDGGLGELGANAKPVGDVAEQIGDAPEIGAGGGLFGEDLSDLGEFELEDGDQDIFFALEAFVDGSKGDTGFGGDIAQANGGESAFFSEFEGRFKDAPRASFDPFERTVGFFLHADLEGVSLHRMDSSLRGLV